MTARVPQRERGKKRVAALLKAGVSLFAEKGYDAVTMTEVAARAGAPIGSLYQFFPNKDALADALLDRFAERLFNALNAIEEQATTLAVPALADLLLGLMAGFHDERAAVAALIESRQETSARGLELKHGLRQHVARILRARNPKVARRRAESMALVIVQLMKAAVAVNADENLAIRNYALNDLRHVMQLYLIDYPAVAAKETENPRRK